MTVKTGYIQVGCSRCGKVWALPPYADGCFCDCHLKCPVCGEENVMVPYVPDVRVGPQYSGELKYLYWHPSCGLKSRSKKRPIFIEVSKI